MGAYSPSGLRATTRGRFVPSFSLRRFHTQLGAALGVVVDEPGLPQSAPPVLEHGPREAAVTYLLGELLSKFDPGDKAGAERRSTSALEKFRDAERQCYETNQRFRGLGVFSDSTRAAILLASGFASRVLGEFSWDSASKYFGWGPGASTRLSRRNSDAAYKFSGIPETTYGNAALADAAICSVPSWRQELSVLGEQDLGMCKYAPGNSIVTVPKNFKTDRTIAIEPCMNMYIQKGIGGLMRERLKLFGCDLNDQTRNQRLARIGSLSGLLATIDLSMASDTVSRRLVEVMIRPDWLKALEQCRSEKGVLPSGEELFYQKFSSMGNGFTFELESLIFYSLALTVTKFYCRPEEVSRVAVYGDDLIVPTTAYEPLLAVLRECGFTPNSKKSFADGPFRESCGKHYFDGHDITPFYVRRPVKTVTDLLLLHNNLVRWLCRTRLVIGEDSTRQARNLILELRALLPAKERRPSLPDGFGDGALVPLWDECICVHLSKDKSGINGWESFDVAVYSSPAKEDFSCDTHGLLLKSLNRLERRKKEGRMGIFFPSTATTVYPVRDTKARKIKIPVPLSALSDS